VLIAGGLAFSSASRDKRQHRRARARTGGGHGAIAMNSCLQKRWFPPTFGRSAYTAMRIGDRIGLTYTLVRPDSHEMIAMRSVDPVRLARR
jgi:hypothetical protein